MARNGTGTYSLPAGNPVVNGTTISDTWANTTLSDIATALTNSIAKDGQTTPTANIPMGGYKITGLGAATTNGDAVRYEQLPDVSNLVTGQASSVDSEIALFSGTGGKTIKRASMTGIVKAASGVASAATAGTDYVKPDTTSALSAGFTATDYNAGTKSSGTFTPDPASGNFQYAVNGGAHTLAPPSASCTMIIQYTNNGSAGAITTSGFTKVSGSFTTTNGDDFICFITRCNGFSSLDIKALQ